MSGIARRVTATGFDAQWLASELAEGLAGDGLRLAVVFADWRIDPAVLARELQRALPAPVVGCTTIGVIGGGPGAAATAAAIAFYGDWIRVGIGVANELPSAALVRGRDAVHAAAEGLGADPESLTPDRHVAITLVDGSCHHEEAFCIASAATIPQLRVVGASAATEPGSSRRAFVWANGEALADAGVVMLVDSALPFEAITSQHMLPTAVKTVVTAASGRTIDELDGRPAASRLRELVAQLGGTVDEVKPSEYAFARFVDALPYLRSMTRVEGERIHLACGVEPGHVLRLMRPGDLIGQTRADLVAVATRVGGSISALLAFSCIGRHWEAAARGLDDELARAYGEYPTIGFQSFGEQSGMLLVNHTLTALAIGARP